MFSGTSLIDYAVTSISKTNNPGQSDFSRILNPQSSHLLNLNFIRNIFLSPRNPIFGVLGIDLEK